MTRALIAAALTAAMTQTFSPAVAQAGNTLKTLVTLERLASPPGPAVLPVITRSAAIKVTGKVHIVSQSITGPLFCSVRFSYSDSSTQQYHSESKSNPITINGNIGTCHITVPFEWENITAAATIPVSVKISTIRTGSSVNAAVTAPEPLRVSEFDEPTVPLPAEGDTALLAFDIRI